MDNSYSSVKQHAGIVLYWNQLAKYIQYVTLYMLHLYYIEETSLHSNHLPEIFAAENNFKGNFS